MSFVPHITEYYQFHEGLFRPEMWPSGYFVFGYRPLIAIIPVLMRYPNLRRLLISSPISGPIH